MLNVKLIDENNADSMSCMVAVAAVFFPFDSLLFFVAVVIFSAGKFFFFFCFNLMASPKSNKCTVFKLINFPSRNLIVKLNLFSLFWTLWKYSVRIFYLFVHKFGTVNFTFTHFSNELIYDCRCLKHFFAAMLNTQCLLLN